MYLRYSAARSFQAAQGDSSDGQEEKKETGRLNKSVGKVGTLVGTKKCAARMVLYGFDIQLGLGSDSHGHSVVSGCARMIWFLFSGGVFLCVVDALLFMRFPYLRNSRTRLSRCLGSRNFSTINQTYTIWSTPRFLTFDVTFAGDSIIFVSIGGL